MFQVIARFLNGQVLKGITADFSPAKAHFHLLPIDSCPGTRPTAIAMAELKGVFFVRRMAGNPAHRKSNAFDPRDLTPGKRMRVVFLDGEVLQGHAWNYHPGQRGVFLLPADPCSNNVRCFVVTAATRDIRLLL